MASLHENLYQSADQDYVNIKYYFTKIIEDLNKAYSTEKSGIEIFNLRDGVVFKKKNITDL